MVGLSASASALRLVGSWPSRAGIGAPHLWVAFALGLGASPLAAQTYTFDPTHTFVHFEVLHFDAATLRGRLGPLQGRAELNPTARSGRIEVQIPLEPVSTGLPVLDALLRGPQGFDVQTHPNAYFVAPTVDYDKQGRLTAVHGEFTLRGISRPLSLRAERFRCYTNPLFRREVCGGDFVGEIRRSEFGVDHSLAFVSDRVVLRIQVEGIRAAE